MVPTILKRLGVDGCFQVRIHKISCTENSLILEVCKFGTESSDSISGCTPDTDTDAVIPG